MLPAAVCGLLFLCCWAALGCYALREFSYSRFEEICNEQRRPERFGQVLKQQEPTLLALELTLTIATLCFSAGLCALLGVPARGPDGAINGWDTLQFALEYGGFALIVMIAADVLPWMIARVSAEPFLFHFWPLMRAVHWLLFPVLAVAKRADRVLHGICGLGDPDHHETSSISEEIRTVVDEGQREGLLESEARTMIHRVIELGDEDVGAIMTPRTDMDCIPVETSIEDARRRLLEVGHSRVPVIGESTDDIIGILYAKDLLRALDPSPRTEGPLVLREIVRDPIFIPESTDIQALLEMMKRQRVQIAIVLDEYGGVAGLVTMEDILEEIVGEIEDEYDAGESGQQIVQLRPNVAEVDARARIEECNEALELSLPVDGDYETIGGFVFAQFGRIPHAGEVVAWGPLKFTAIEVDKRKLNRIQIEVVTVGEADKDAPAS